MNNLSSGAVQNMVDTLFTTNFDRDRKAETPNLNSTVL